MALADEADDDGVCWPSIRRIAKKSGVSERTVRRMISEHRRGNLLQVSARVRANGGQSSSSYKLLMDVAIPTPRVLPAPDKLSPPDASDREWGVLMAAHPLTRPCQEGPDTAVSGHYPLQEPLPRATTSQLCRLEAPRLLSTPDSRIAIGLVTNHIPSTELAQQVLDELDAKLGAGGIRGSWESYLWGLIRKVERGAFVAAAGREVARKRGQQKPGADANKREIVPVSTEAAKTYLAMCKAELQRGCDIEKKLLKRVGE